MVDLYTALKLTGDLDSNDNIVFLKKLQEKYSFNECMTVRQIKEQYDMRKTKVIKISSHFSCEEYQEFLFTIIE